MDRIMLTLRYSSDDTSFLSKSRFIKESSMGSFISDQDSNESVVSQSQSESLGSTVEFNHLTEGLDMEHVSSIMRKDDKCPGPTALHVACEHGHVEVKKKKKKI